MATMISHPCLVCLMLALAILSTLSSSVSSVRILSLNTSPESYHHQNRHRQSVHPLPFDAMSPSSSESMVESLPHQQLSSSLIEPSLFLQESYPVNIPLDFSTISSMNNKQGISSNNLNGVDTTNDSFDFNSRLMDRLLSSLRNKRSGIADQRLAELETEVALKKFRNALTARDRSVAYGLFDPDRIGRRRRRFAS